MRRASVAGVHHDALALGLRGVKAEELFEAADNGGLPELPRDKFPERAAASPRRASRSGPLVSAALVEAA